MSVKELLFSKSARTFCSGGGVHEIDSLYSFAELNKLEKYTHIYNLHFLSINPKNDNYHNYSNISIQIHKN